MFISKFPHTQKNVALFQLDISMSYCCNSWELFCKCEIINWNKEINHFRKPLVGIFHTTWHNLEIDNSCIHIQNMKTFDNSGIFGNASTILAESVSTEIAGIVESRPFRQTCQHWRDCRNNLLSTMLSTSSTISAHCPKLPKLPALSKTCRNCRDYRKFSYFG